MKLAVIKSLSGHAKLICYSIILPICRNFAGNIAMVVTEVGRKPCVFGDAALVAQKIMNANLDFSKGQLIFNMFRSVVSYRTTAMPIYSTGAVANATKLPVYDSLDADVLQSYLEYSLASLIYYGMKENATSEQSSRMTSMDNASKNAGTSSTEEHFLRLVHEPHFKQR